MRFEWVHTKTTRLYEAGDGESVLLIHGGQFGSLYSLDCWSLALDALAGSFRVIAYDRPGQGYTEAPLTAPALTMSTVTAHATEVLTHVVGEPAHVVGHSRGGAVATRLAIEAPELVRSLTIVDSGSMAPADPGIPVGSFYAPFEHLVNSTTPDPAAVRAEPEAQAFDRDWITPDFVDRMLAIAARPETHDIRRRFAEAEHTHWRPTLERTRRETLAHIDAHGLAVPTLVLWGHADRSAPRHLGQALFDRIAARTPVASMSIVARAGHYSFRDQPDWFLRETTSFWRSLGSRA